jgi:DNA-binding response OmpR family regulator
MPADPTVLDLTGCRVELARGVIVARDGTRTRLAGRELDLLRYLAARPSQVVSRERVMAEVWGRADGVGSRACDDAVRRLRGKIEVDPASPAHLVTVRGEGWRLEPGASAAAPAAAARPAAAALQLGPRSVDLARHRVTGPDGESVLSANEVAILHRLLRADGAVVDRATLQRDVWGRAGGGRALDNAIFRLRQKLEDAPDAPVHLLTERGGGYRLRRPAAAIVAEPDTSYTG